MNNKILCRILIIVMILSDCFNNKLNWMCIPAFATKHKKEQTFRR